jgi:hypothetical protein
MKETQDSIGQWCEETFGPVPTNIRIAARANDELAELIHALSFDDRDWEKAAEETADVVIALCRLAHNLGFDLWAAVEYKMEVNRRRRWVVDGAGCGKHVKEHH